MTAQRGHFERARVEYRVETRSTNGHPNGPSDWFPEGDHTVFTDRTRAEQWLHTRAEWYGAPGAWEHRIVQRTVSPWDGAS